MGGWIFDWLLFYIQKKNAVTSTLVLIVTMAISRDMVVVAAVDYRKQCPATRDTQDMQIPKYDVLCKCIIPFAGLSSITTDKTDTPNRTSRVS